MSVPILGSSTLLQSRASAEDRKVLIIRNPTGVCELH